MFHNCILIHTYKNSSALSNNEGVLRYSKCAADAEFHFSLFWWAFGKANVRQNTLNYLKQRTKWKSCHTLWTTSDSWSIKTGAGIPIYTLHDLTVTSHVFILLAFKRQTEHFQVFQFLKRVKENWNIFKLYLLFKAKRKNFTQNTEKYIIV